MMPATSRKQQIAMAIFSAVVKPDLPELEQELEAESKATTFEDAESGTIGAS